MPLVPVCLTHTPAAVEPRMSRPKQPSQRRPKHTATPAHIQLEHAHGERERERERER